MNKVTAFRVFAATALAAMSVPAMLAQYPLDPDARGSISGTAVHYDSGNPMRRVQVLLNPDEENSTAVAARTDEHGGFRFSDLPSGHYALSARRPGFLPAAFAETEHTRLPMIFPLLPGENLKGIVIRIRPAGVLSGRVQFGDAEPVIGTTVQIFREYFYRGRHGFQRASQAPTDDRGQYRIFGLPPGKYYIVATYAPPDPGEGVKEQVPRDDKGRPLPAEDFVTTYYPSATAFLQATPVKLSYGEELSNLDIFLSKSPISRVSGQVLSGVTGDVIAGADIRLRQAGPAGDVLVDAPVTVRRRRVGYEVVGVTPGSYTLVVNAQEGRQRMFGRLPLSVAGASVDNVEVTLEPYRTLAGRVAPDSDPTFPLSALRVSLEPRTDSSPVASTSVDEDGSFEVSYVPGETYDIFLLDGPPDLYLHSARIAGFDVLETGFRAEAGSLPEMELMFSEKGGAIRGEISDGPTKVALGATVALIPAPAYGHVQRYQITTTNEYGLYEFRGVTPGRYTVVSWWDDPPCEVYDVESLGACRELGESVEIRAGEQKMVNMPLARSQ